MLDSPATAPNKHTDARRRLIRRLIREQAIHNQAELVAHLKQAGFQVTQSSISRDLREMAVAKRADRYVLPDTQESVFVEFNAVKALVLNILAAGPHLLVIKTTIGSAATVAAAIDRAGWPEVVGTLSGDDTVFLATAEKASQDLVKAQLDSVFPR
jgi:transcriptional regulator of arginine metabolism